MLRHWGYLASGLLFMFGFALFSGASITLAIPLLDNVFKKGDQQIIHTDISSFLQAAQKTIIEFTQTQGSLINIRSKDVLEPLLERLNEILLQTDASLLLWMISITLVVIIIIKNIFYYGQRVCFANLRGKTVRDIRDKMYHKYLYQSFSFFNEKKIGDSLVRMVSDVKILGKFFIRSILNALRDIFLILVFARIAFFINSTLFLISLLILPVFSIVIHYLGGKIKKYSKRIQLQSSDLFSNVEEKLNSIRIVKAFSRENFEMDTFMDINQKRFRYWRKSRIYHAFSVPLSEINGTFIGIVVLLIGGSQVLNPEINFSLGSFFTFLLAIFSMQHPMKNLTKAYANFRKALVSLERISEILERETEISEQQTQIRKKSFNNKIELKNVDFSYDHDDLVLRNINLTINKGKRIALVGGSGAGKTTIVNLVERLYDTSAGKILIDNIPIDTINLKDLRSLFGTVTQDSILFGDTIHNNIRYGSLNKITDDQVQNAAKIAYADEFIDSYKDKYEMMLSSKGANLSGGQKQRLCIARAIVGNPPILIFDEATSALDSESEQAVQLAIKQATENRTVIVIAHRLSTIISADKIVVLDGGEIVCAGKHQELLKSCEKYKTLYELQFEDQQNK